MIRMNLLPVREERRKADIQQQLVLVAGTILLTLLVMGAYHLHLTAKISGVRERSVRLQKEIDDFGPQLAQVEDFRRKKEGIEKKLDVITKLDRARSGPVHMLDELAIHTPERIWLTEIETKGDRIAIEGISLDNELVALFLTSLNGSPYFRDVELEQTELLERDGLKLNEFRVRANVDSPVDDRAAKVVARLPGGAGR
jgi:type IV pilus assembly protein PilN